MKTNQAVTNRPHPDQRQYALRQEADSWEVTFEGRQASFKHELGALYVACLLLEPQREPIHAVALALKAKENFAPVDAAHLNLVGTRSTASPDFQEAAMGLEDAAKVRALWRRQRELERVLEDGLEIERVKAEALRELEEVTEFLRKSPWLSRHGAERCVHAVTTAIKRLLGHLAGAVDGEGKPHPVLQGFARHLHEHLLVPSGRGGGYRRTGTASAPAGSFTYEPPPGVKWEVQSPKPKVRNPAFKVQGSKFQVQSSTFDVHHPSARRPTAVDYLSRFLCVGFALVLLATAGCAATRPLKGGRAVTTHKPAGIIEQTIVQSENPSQASKQTQKSVKVRTYTVPAGSRMEQSQSPPAAPAQRSTLNTQPINVPPSTLNFQPSTALILSAPMPVVEREESRAGTELGASQKDTARELGAKLSSLKGIVWVGVGLFVFGLASLVFPPLKVIIGSVTTSAALMLGGIALMVLPTLIVGNELLILGGVALDVGGWFLAHRHGQLRGMVGESQESKV